MSLRVPDGVAAVIAALQFDKSVTVAPPPECVTVAPVPESVTVAPVPECATVAPVPECVTVAPVPECATVAPVPESVTVAPVPESVTVAPVPESVTVAPVPESVTVAPLPESVTVAPVPESVTEPRPLGSGCGPSPLLSTPAALDFCDRSQLTLILGDVAAAALPKPVRERIALNVADNIAHLAHVRALESQLTEWLAAAGIDFVFLKGTTHWPHFVSVLHLRSQGDLDLYCPQPDARRAWDLLVANGYQPIEKLDAHAIDHLPTLVQKTGWEWHGNPYDPDIPIAIEVHFQFWDAATERLPAPDVNEFWTRRKGRALDTPDALAYASLHLLRHLFRGSARAYHVYELAWFLDHHAADPDFWSRWQAWHSPELRRLEAVAFRLAREWFACALGPVAAAEVAALPPPVQDWFASYAFSPLETTFRPNKDELWLHLALVEATRDKWAVARRRLLPTQLPGPMEGTCLPAEQLTFARRTGIRLRYLQFLAGRVWFHARTTPPLLAGGARWWMRSSGLSEGYWAFLAASSFFVLGMFIYVLLYNLYLLDLGFHEDFIGKLNSASTAGMVVATLPAAAIARRFGLSKLLLVFFAALAAVSSMRALVTGAAPLLALSFLSGAVFSVYAVSLAPAIARLTSEKSRSIGFSISTASSIALGILGGWIGGHLPGWLGGKRPAMLAACGLVALAVWPATWLKIGPAPAEDGKLYPRNRFVIRFLMVFALWNLATGAFNPFFATFFARLHFPVERIGLVFSASQLSQVVALMLAPLVLRRLGLVSGTAAMLLATSAALAALATGPVGFAAPVLFCCYTASQWMTDPGINTLLMDRVREAERGGAAALMMLVSFAAQLAASWIGGSSITKFGYSTVLACSAILAAIAALAFRSLPE